MVIIPTSAPFDEYGSHFDERMVAYSQSCQEVDGMPSVIGIHLNSYYLENAYMSDYKRILESTVLHEVLHGLGFNFSDFVHNDMIDSN